MARVQSKATAAIQKLLEERQQIYTWLQRLSMATDGTPEHVRSRVRQDYEVRLNEVMKELKDHGGDVTATLERSSEARAGLARQEREAAERLAEAELRHAVGEYDESQWRQVHADLLGALVKVREELKQADDEIARLEEVLSLIEVGSSRAVPRPARPEIRKEPAMPPRKKEAAAPSNSGKIEGLGELEFLRSVTEDEGHGPSASRASGSMRAIQEPGASGRGADASDDQDAASRAKANKTLKCKECGTLNLPTEWYCERCGAELAAL